MEIRLLFEENRLVSSTLWLTRISLAANPLPQPQQRQGLSSKIVYRSFLDAGSKGTIPRSYPNNLKINGPSLVKGVLNPRKGVCFSRFGLWGGVGFGGLAGFPYPTLLFLMKNHSLLTWLGWGQVNFWPIPQHCPSFYILNRSHSLWNFRGIWF